MKELYNIYMQYDIAIRTISYSLITFVYMYWMADSFSKKDYLGTVARAFTALLLVTGIVYRLSGDYNMVLFFTTPTAVAWAMFSAWAAFKRIRDRK